MKHRHSAFAAVFVAAALTACAILPYSVVRYIDACESGFGARLEIEKAVLFTPNSVDILLITFRYSSPDRLSTLPEGYFFNVTVGDSTVFLAGSISKTFDRGVSDAGTVSTPVTAEQSLVLASAQTVSLDYWLWVDVPYRGSGSPIEGSATVPLEVA